MATATFLGIDSTTKGNWLGVYGLDGYYLWDNTGVLLPGLPDYIDSITDDGTNFTLDGGTPTDVKYPQLPDASGRTSYLRYQEDFYGPGNPRNDVLTIDLVANDEDQPYELSLYAAMVVPGRLQEFTIKTPDGVTTLATSDRLDYEDGYYWRFLITGSVKIVGWNGFHPSVLGYFFDPVDVGPAPSIGRLAGLGTGSDGLAL